jgi:hypothetical protein
MGLLFRGQVKGIIWIARNSRSYLINKERGQPGKDDQLYLPVPPGFVVSIEAYKKWK